MGEQPFFKHHGQLQDLLSMQIAGNSGCIALISIFISYHQPDFLYRLIINIYQFSK